MSSDFRYLITEHAFQAVPEKHVLNVDESSRRVAIFKIAFLKILKNHLKASSVKLFLRTDSFKFFCVGIIHSKPAKILNIKN